jgi:hypothetical protein
MRFDRIILSLLPVVGFVFCLAPVQAQVVIRPQHKEPLAVNSGKHSNSKAQVATPFQQVLVSPGAAWLRFHLKDHQLGKGSYLTLTSALDGAQQRLDANSLLDWENGTAYFNGDSVQVELHLAPGDKNAYIEFDEMTVGEFADGDTLDGMIESLCAGDNRVASTDVRVGRITGCTAWLNSNGSLLTAGHCADYDPDRGGPLLPDGILDLGGVVEFDIPQSLANGTLVAADPNDQYPIDTSSVVWNFDGEGQGLGKDWAMFRCNPNSNTGLLPHEARNSFFRMTRENPVIANTIRITGCGVDETPAGSTGGRNSDNRTLQTSTGPYVGEFSSGANFWHRYQVDTEGANSGSPIIWTSTGFTIGVHTNGGCNTDGSGSNSGTSFEHNPLETALQNFPGANTTYLDAVSPPGSPTEDGTVFRPFNTLPEAVADVVSGARILAVRGNYTQAAGNTGLLGDDGKSFLITAPVGTATFGD